VAGVFMEDRKGKLGEMEYTCPFFEIREIYLWPIKRRFITYPSIIIPGTPDMARGGEAFTRPCQGSPWRLAGDSLQEASYG
jgi:starvation-inducible outer membrane lipoprotein